MSNADNDFSGSVYVVTGSTQGIGAEVALALARSGAGGIVICGRNREGGEKTKRAVEAEGAAVEYVRADLEKVDDCRAVAAACDKTFGRVDGLVNAAGTTDRGTIESTTPEQWDRLFAVNARAPFLLMQDVIAIMRRTGTPGSIVNVITMSSHGGQPFLTGYSASKGALATLTKNVAHAVRGDRIRVNGINIGWADTPAEHVIQRKDGSPVDWLAWAEPSSPLAASSRRRMSQTFACFYSGPSRVS